MATPAAIVDARPTAVDLYLYAGDDVSLHIAVKDAGGVDVDLTTYTAEAQIRGTADAPLSADFTATTTATGVDLVMAAADTSTLPPKGVWDCQIINATGQVTTVAAGKVTVTGEVSR